MRSGIIYVLVRSHRKAFVEWNIVGNGNGSMTRSSRRKDRRTYTVWKWIREQRREAYKSTRAPYAALRRWRRVTHRRYL